MCKSYQTLFFALAFYRLLSFPINYAEFTIVREEAKISYPDSWWKNVFVMSVSFRRATNHYILFTILPNIIFSYLSCLQYALDVREGERLSYSVTILLITITQSIVSASLLPVCRENLWLNTFNFFSMIFCVFGIIETCIIFILLGIVKKKCHHEEGSLAVGTQQNHEELVSMIALDERNADMSVNTQFDMHRNIEVSPSETNQMKEKDETRIPAAEPSRRRNIWRRLNVVRILTTKPTSAEDLMVRIDTAFLYVMPFAYSIFLVYMFASNSSWDD